MRTYLAYIFFTISGLVLMKLGGGHLSVGLKDGSFSLNIGFKLLLAFAMYGTSFILWTGIVAKNDLGYIVPITSAITNTITLILGILIFNENITIFKGMGILLATIGVMMMNL